MGEGRSQPTPHPSGGAGSIYCHASEKLMGRWGPTPNPSQEGNLGEMGRWGPTPHPSGGGECVLRGRCLYLHNYSVFHIHINILPRQ
ncbi:MAG: hypothetical protein F6K48_29460 [Okeania sp. SIO3H1]|uniref:hypothetical protein n=1 Tax=Okeania sp. SIO1I7 TaxID=2607772 RepID=UPI0013CC8FE4|nr:hypothetical protein [Okeania sp. SIO1I7]NEN92801.1 hypothetical protein [Okeania sp. SIO3H1]NET25951.1 hypothetical protein [Okeania sp. SIO1I7]